MANVSALDSTSSTVEFAADGAGSTGDPHIPHQRVTAVDVPSTLSYGQGSVTTAGSSVALVVSSTPLSIGVTVQANADNAGNIFIGDGLAGLDLRTTGYVLTPGNSHFIPVSDAIVPKIDAANGGDGFSFIGN